MAIAIHRPVRRRVVRTPHTGAMGHMLISTVALVGTLLITLLLPGDNPARPIPSTVRVSENDAGSTVRLHTGDTLQVSLEGNPSTGYSWEMVEADTAVLKQSGEPEFTSYKHAGQFVGSPGTVTMTFTMVGAGQTVLKLIYCCPFEENVQPLKTFELKVVIGN